MYLFPLEMYGNQEDACIDYFKLGDSIFNTVQQVINWRFGQFSNIRDFLDFASGYGRFTRYLTQHMRREKIFVSDIYPKSIEFQKKYNGVQGLIG